MAVLAGWLIARARMGARPVFTDEYESLWRRDLALMQEMGANAVRLYSFKTSVRHLRFLDHAYELKITVRQLVGKSLLPYLKTPPHASAW
jgi:hypothetical protein